jgi:hypothetical protein
MSLNYVTLTLDLYDGQGNPVIAGTASFTPSAVLTDAGVEIVGQQPVTAVFHAAALPAVKLLATDNSGPAPSGWTWSVTFSGITGAPASFSFFLPYAGGATQLLSSLIPVSAGATFSDALAQSLRVQVLRPSGGDDTGAFRAALAALPAVTVNNGVASTTYPAGTIYLASAPASAPFKIGVTADIGNIGPFVSVIGAGSTACYIYDYGQTAGGAGLFAHNAIRPSDDTFDTMLTQAGAYGTGAVLAGFTLDGTHAAAGRYGLDVGDFEPLDLRDLKVQHYNGAGSIGVNFNNKYAWFNGYRGRVIIYDCTTHAQLSGKGSPTGDIYNTFNDLEFYLYPLAGQDGVSLVNGCQYQFGSLKIRASCLGSASPQTNAVLRITGNDGAGNSSALLQCHLEITAETDGGGGTNGPYSIYYGDVVANTISNCSGQLTFHTCRTTNWSVTNSFGVGNFTFNGMIVGDANLAQGSAGAWGTVLAGAVAYPIGESFTNGGVPLQGGDFFPSLTLTQSITVAFQHNPASAQRKVLIFKQAASGGPYTVTWPHAGSPTTGSPTILWAGGSAPVMTATASATDVYELITADGATWYGKAIQNVS